LLSQFLCFDEIYQILKKVVEIATHNQINQIIMTGFEDMEISCY